MDNPDTSTPAQGDVPNTQPAQTIHGPPSKGSMPSLTSSNDTSSHSPPAKESPPSHAGTSKDNPPAGHPTPPVEPVDRLSPPSSGSNIADNATTALESQDPGLSHITTASNTASNTANGKNGAGNPTPPISPLQPLSLSTAGGDPVTSNTIPISSTDSIKRRRSGSSDDQEVPPEPCQSAVVPTSHNDMSRPSEDSRRKRQRLQRSITFILPIKPHITNDDSDSDDDDMRDDADDDDDGGAPVDDDDFDSDDSSGWGSDESLEDHECDVNDYDETGGAPTQSQQGIQLPRIQDHLLRPSVESAKLPPLLAHGNVQSSSEKMLARIKKRPGLDLSRLKQYRPVPQSAAARSQGAAAFVWDYSIALGREEEKYVRPCHRIHYYETKRHTELDVGCTNSAEYLDLLDGWARLRNGAYQAVLFYKRLKDKVPWLHPMCVADVGCKLGNGTLAILPQLPEYCAVQGWDRSERFIKLANGSGELTVDAHNMQNVNFSVMGIQEFKPRYEDLVLCMDSLQVMSRLGRVYTMERILNKMQENAVLAISMPNSCSLPYKLFRETVEERGPWNRCFETENILFTTGAQAFRPLEPMVQWEATVAPYCQGFLVQEVVDPFPIPKGSQSVYEWMQLEIAPMIAQLNDDGAKSQFLQRYKQKLDAAYKPKFGQGMSMDITTRYLIAVRGARDSDSDSEDSDVDSLSSEDSGPTTPSKEEEFRPRYSLKRASDDSLGMAPGYVFLCPHAVSFSCTDMLCLEAQRKPGGDPRRVPEEMEHQ